MWIVFSIGVLVVWSKQTEQAALCMQAIQAQYALEGAQDHHCSCLPFRCVAELQSLVLAATRCACLAHGVLSAPAAAMTLCLNMARTLTCLWWLYQISRSCEPSCPLIIYGVKEIDKSIALQLCNPLDMTPVGLAAQGNLHPM